MSLHRKFQREVAAIGLPDAPGPTVDESPITEADLAPLPPAAQRYLRFMRVVGRRRDWSFRLGFTGRFRRSAADPWMACEAWQYNSRLSIARIFYMKLRLFGLVPVVGRDTYADGHGRMLVRPLDLFTIVDGQGEPFDIGELVTYLNDAVMIAPTLLLVPEVTWSAVDDDAFDVTLTDRGRTVRARVVLDERGAPRDFETNDRFYDDPKEPGHPVRCRWTTPVEGWQDVGDRRLPTRGQAVWHPPEGDLPYADFTFDPSKLAFDVAPGC